MSGEKRTGRQTPTLSVVSPYDKTYGPEAIALYNLTSRTALEWQELISYDILAINDDGLWVHSTFGYSVPRQNGKNEVVSMRELWGLFNDEKIIHTAHRRTTSTAAFERLCIILSETGLKEDEDYKTIKQKGAEEIIMLKGCKGRIFFRTRSAKGGLGESFDLLVIDEAQEYTDDQQAALIYTISASKNPQIIMLGTPPTTESSGTVFVNFRKDCIRGDAEDAGWAEWSVPHMSDTKDRDLWYETNPSLGYRISERTIVSQNNGDDIDFNIQRLGLWIQYNQKSAISKEEWQELEVNKIPSCKKRLFAGVKYDKDNTNVSLSVALKTTDEKYFIECIDTRPIREGTEWLVNKLCIMAPDVICIDGINGAEKLEKDLKDSKCKSKIIFPSTKEYVTANSLFEDAVTTKKICHLGQPSLEAVVSNCEHRAIGTSGGFGYRALREGYEIGLLDSVVLALWICSVTKDKKPMKVVT